MSKKQEVIPAFFLLRLKTEQKIILEDTGWKPTPQKIAT